jgi:ABC-type molybdate transport system substrate-binding protein
VRRIVHADFDGTEYGDEYVHLLTNDLVIMIDHSQNSDEWSFARNLRTQAVGCIPLFSVRS